MAENLNFLFPQEVQIRGIRLNASDDLLRCNLTYQVDKYLFVVDPDNQHAFSIVDIKQDSLVKRWGDIGEGPCDLQPISIVNSLEKGRVGIHLMNRFTYKEFDLLDILNEDQLNCDEVKNNLHSDFYRIVKLDETRFLGLGVFENRYALLRKEETDPYNSFSNYHFEKEMKDRAGRVAMAMASQGDLVLKPDGSKAFFGTYNFIAFDILSIEEEDIFVEKRVSYSSPEFEQELGSNSVSVNYSEKNTFGFQKAVATDRYIYTLFSGKNKKTDSYYSDLVYVFNWKGEPVKKIKLDREVKSLTVAPDDSYLTGDIDDGKANLYRFDL